MGRPWNKVHSEICKFIRVDSAVQSHVRDHLQDFVEMHVIEIAGVACYGSGYWIGQPLQAHRCNRFYVCPRTGLLRSIPHAKRHPIQSPVDHVAIDEQHEYRLTNGIWYLVEYRPLTAETMYARDVITGKTASFAKGDRRYAARRCQLNKREIARLAYAGAL